MPSKEKELKDMKAAKKKRLSSVHKPSRDSKENESPLLEENDDEAEKRERRKSKAIELNLADMDEEEDVSGEESPKEKAILLANKRKSIGINTAALKAKNALSSKSSQSSQSKKKSQLSNGELTELYANCIKLSTENKINTKNTWDLELIDYIDDVIAVQKSDVGEISLTNFQVASCTLDASVKIYSCRVDSVHNETFKVLGGLSRTAYQEGKGEEALEEKGENEEEKEENKEVSEENEKKKQKKVKKAAEVGGVNTLEANPENISLKKFDLAFDVDPLFKKTSAAFDEGGAKGLLLNHLSVFNNCQIIFDSSDAIIEDDDTSPNKDSTCAISELSKKVVSLVDDIDTLEICPTFSHFNFGKPDEEDNANNEDMADFNAAFDDDEDIPGIEFNAADPFEDIEQQEQRLLQDIQVQDDDEDHLQAGQIVQDSVLPQSQQQEKMGDLTFMFTEANDFAYFDPKTLQNWAGPNHWKFRGPPKDVTASSTTVEKTKKKKEAFFFDFKSEDTTDYEKAFAPPGRGTTTLSSAVLKKASEKNNLLPPDVHYDIKMLTQLFNKPKWRVSLNKRKRDEPMEDIGGGFHFTAEPITADPFDAPDNADDDHEYIIEPPAADIQLIAEPRKVEQIKINYAKTAKFVDVKALKEDIWKELKENEIEETKKGQSFADVLETLPEKVPAEALPNVSVPFCFICLLHLANEKGLEIDQKKGSLGELFIHTKVN